MGRKKLPEEEKKDLIRIWIKTSTIIKHGGVEKTKEKATEYLEKNL